MNWPHESSTQELNEFYGNPAGGNGHYDERWFRDNVVELVPPYKMRFSWGPPVGRLLFHKKCKAAFEEGFQNVLKLYKTQAEIEAHRLHLTGGSFMFRLMRGSATKLSTHSWAVALDLDPQHNPFRSKWRPGFIPLEAAKCFQNAGIVWRGANGDVDCMHFQAVEHTWAK